MWKCFKTFIVKAMQFWKSKWQPKKRKAKWSMWKCFKTVIVKVFHSDNLEKGSKVIHVEVFQNSHCQSVSQWQPKKG